ncbi:hypothetical protein AM499_11315 [Bacillus sp. FJAT-22090]|uniref:DUF6470 family protein n=1 Tax=Bacillus sp. FJAT-22090 TaxID=1581038 RepID=UPI0006ADF80F|nr:DUF6470 family protein [Bacillus sp. FJAT-22090]ALC86353.1 hypothetical protein AM499_11315 [Bacillus sp. FJAT-22090]
MNFPQIQIRTTDARLGLNIDDPKQMIRQPKATQHIEQPAAIVDIETTRGLMKIDSSQARRDVGLIGPLESTKKYASEGRQKVMQGIARRASEGRQMMDIAHNSNAIASIAKKNTFPTKAKLGIDFIPSIGSVKLDYTPAKVDINVQIQHAKINAQVNKPIHEYTPGNVSGFMLLNPSIEIDFIV